MVHYIWEKIPDDKPNFKARMKRLRRITAYLSIGFLFASCSTQRLAVRVTGDLLVKGISALYEENDLQLAEQAIGSNLKLLEVFLKNDPGNQRLLSLLAEGYTSFALGFVEDQSPARASELYHRAFGFGLRALQSDGLFQKGPDIPLDRFKDELQRADRDQLPALFWTASAWANFINLNKSDVQAVAQLPKVQAMMERVLELDSTYYYGGAHLFLGIYYASRPRILGGDPEKARQHFEACLRINKGKFLLAKLFYAQYYCVQTQNRELFHKLLNEILNEAADILPEQRLANEIARRKAKLLLEKEDELFF